MDVSWILLFLLYSPSSGSVVQENVFTITVHTSDIAGAGTDANVHCVLYGEKGGWGLLPLMPWCMSGFCTGPRV